MLIFFFNFSLKITRLTIKVSIWTIKQVLTIICSLEYSFTVERAFNRLIFTFFYYMLQVSLVLILFNIFIHVFIFFVIFVFFTV